MSRRRGYSSSEEEEEDPKTGRQKKGNQFVQRTQQLSPMQDDTYSDPTQYIPGPDYSDSDYLGNSSLSETVGVVGGPRYPPVGTTSKRSLNDRVRDYTGVRQDERLEHPAGSSSSRSSDSRSPFLDPSTRTGRRRGQGSTSPRDQQVEWSGLALAERNYETVPALRGEAVWETKLDQEYLKYGTVGNSQRPDIVLANIQGNKTLGHKPIYCPDPSETAALVGAKIVMPGFPVQTLGGHQSPPYSPSREKQGLLGRPCAPYCSWRLVALSLTLLILLLASVIVYFGAVKYPQPLPPLPNSVIDSNGLRDLNCPPVNTQLEEPSGGLQAPWTGPRSSPSPASLLPGQWLKAEVPPLSTWTGRIAVSRTALYQLNFTLIAGVGEGAALFGRLQAVATVTRHDWQEYLVSSRQRRAVSSTHLGVYTVERSLSDGAWFISLYNDGPSRLQFGVVVNERAGGRGCEHNCSGRGRCLPDGECECEAQFSGKDCSANICPVLCSGHGDYGGGR